MENNNKGQENFPEKSHGLEQTSLFRNSNFSIYVYKKTEKIISALYMVTNLIGNNEPVKWDIREKGLELLSYIVYYAKMIGLKDREGLVKDIEASVLEIRSLLEISYHGGLLSQMNFEILSRELLNFLTQVNARENIANQSLLFPDSFFSVDPAYLEERKREEKTFVLPEEFQKFAAKRPESIKDMSLKNISPSAVAKEPKQKDTIKTDKRREAILGILKKKKEITIADVSLIIKDCSQKTLQRMLLSMVSEGVLKKEGERRWSKYSLA